MREACFKKKNQYLEGIILALFLLSIDTLTKYLTRLYLPKMGIHYPHYPYGGVGVFHHFLGGINFSINYVQNRGAAWGLFAAFPDLLLAIRILVAIFLLSYLLFFVKDLKKQIPLLLILIGAVGNILDIFLYGYVVDLFYFTFWGYSFPVFNLADSLISIGIAIFLIQSFFFSKPSHQQEA